MIRNIAAQVEHQVRFNPTAVSVIDTRVSLTYQQLWCRVLDISRSLQCAGVRPEENVGVLLPRCTDLVAAVLAVWHAGGALVPVDPDDPARRNRHILDLAQCRVLVTNGEALTTQHGLVDSEHSGDVIDVDAVIPGDAPPARYLDEAGLAYILFTSGSTGTPKGVEIEHRSVAHLLQCVKKLIKVSQADRFLATATIGFDVSFGELFLPLTEGASILLRHREMWLTPAVLAREVREHGVTVCSTGPSVWALALSSVPDFPALRIALSSGEAMLPWVAKRLPEVAQYAWNFYGPTETTIWTSGHRMLGDDAERDYNNIGPLYSDMECRIVSTDGAICPPAEQGELLLCGPLLARGYHRNPAANARSFVDINGRRHYRTGDLVACDHQGNLWFYGRNDDQIQVRGVRVEPAEIESTLLQHPEVQTAAVTWFDREDGVRVIAAAYVGVDEPPPSRSSVAAWVADRLPSAMQPTRWLALISLPTTPSNKVDRIALRSLFEDQQSVTPMKPAADLTVTQSQVTQIWQNVLRQPRVELDDNFLELGGDSFSLVRMVAAVEQTLGFTISMANAFERSTVRTFCAYLDEMVDRTTETRENDYVFRIADHPGSKPLFFCDIALQSGAAPHRQLQTSLFAISSWATGEGFMPVQDIATLARRQIGNIRRYQPVGPYRLAGFSFGGMLVQEMAAQLESLGEEVEFVFLLDPFSPQQLEQELAVGLWKRLVRWWQFRITDQHIRSPGSVTKWLLPADNTGAFIHFACRCARTYKPRPFHGKSVLVVIEDRTDMAYWNQMLPNLAATRTLDAAHDALHKEPSANDWLQLLKDHLN